ncbi:MAG: ImmA/IrrE family metallo-endopeptidase [Agrobacterium cavarae]
MIEEHAAPDWFSKPGDSIRAVMQRRGIAARDLASLFDDGMETVRGLLDGSAPIDEEAAVRLASLLGASKSFWLRRQENFDLAVNRAVERIRNAEDEDLVLSLPAPGAKPRGRLTEAKKAEEVRRRLVYFNVPTVTSWALRYGRLVGNTDFRTSNAFSSSDDATLLWLRRGELESDMISTRTWNPGNLEDRLSEIRKLSRLRHPDAFLPKLRELLAEVGVALVVVKPPQDCKASGAARMVDSDKAMILMSFRYRSDDHFWFTLFHEIGHLLLHQAHTFVDGDETPVNEKELEANGFAESCIIPSNRSSEFERLRPNKDDVLRFSVSIGVAPGLTVGQMQHREMIGRDKLNYLKRRWNWDDIISAVS